MGAFASLFSTRTRPTATGAAARAGRDVIAPVPADWRCDSGDRLADTEVRARLAGPPGAPVVAVLGGISAGRFVAAEPGASEGAEAGWWAGLARPGGGVDLDRYQVLGVDFSPRDADAPIAITPADQARLLALAMDAAGVERLHAFVGASYGGMIALAFARLFPERVERLVIICAAHRPHPMATAWRGVQRRILAFASACGKPEEGVELARQLAMTTYRTPEEFAERFRPGIPAGAEDSETCGYLKARGTAYAAFMTPARFASLSAAIDRHDEDPAAIAAPTLLIGSSSDRLVPLADMRELANRLAGPARLVEIESLYGHDSFLKEIEMIAPHVRAALDAPPATPFGTGAQDAANA